MPQTPKLLSVPPDSEKEKESLSYVAKGGLFSLISLGVGKVATFLMEVYLARVLGVSNYGIYSLSRTIVKIPNFATDLGLPQGVVRFGSLFRSNEENQQLKGLLIGALSLVISVGLLVSWLIFANADIIARWFSEPLLIGPIKIFAWIMAPSGVAGVIAAFARSQLRINVDLIVRALSLPIGALILSVVLVGFWGTGLVGAAYAFLAAMVVSALLGFYYLFRLWGLSLRQVAAHFQIRQLLRFSIPTFLLGVSTLLLRHTSRLLLGYFDQADSVGVFTAASALSENLSLSLLAINPIFAPLVASAYENGRHDELATSFRTITRWQLTITLPLGLIMMVYADELMLLFGKEFQVASIVIIVLVSGQLINVGTGPVGMVLQMTGHQDLELLNGIGVFLLNLGMGFWLIPAYGVIGAGLTTAVALSVIHLVRLTEIYFILHIIPYDRSFLKIIAAIIVGLLMVTVFNDKIVIESLWIRFAVGSLLIILIYLSMIFVLKLEQSDKDMLQKFLIRLKKL